MEFWGLPLLAPDAGGEATPPPAQAHADKEPWPSLDDHPGLELLAASQRRIESALADVSRLQESTSKAVADMTRDLGSVVDFLRGHSDGGGRVSRCSSQGRGSRGWALDGFQPPAADHGGSVLQRAGWARSANVLSPSPGSSVRSFNDFNECHSRASMSGDIALALPSGWPSSIAIRETFVKGRDQDRSYFRSDSHLTTKFAKKKPLGSSRLERLENDMQPHRRRCRLMLSPNSHLRMAFDLCSFIILFYELFVVPFLLAWGIPFSGFPNFAFTIAAGFWTLNLILNFMSGYQRGGVLVMEPAVVARHYMKTWFLPDVIMLVCDWLSIVLVRVAEATSESQGGSSLGVEWIGYLRMGRFLRVLAVFRMIKFVLVIEEHVQNKLSESYRLLVGLGAAVFGTFWLNHLMACTFFAIGRLAPSNTGAHWIDRVQVSGGREINFSDEDIMYQYVTSIHWAVSQITLGAIDVNAINTYERVFNIFMLLLGLVFGSTMISSLSTSMVEFHVTTRDKKEMLRTLRTYLRENNVDRNIASLVQQQAAERLGKKPHIQGEDVHALSLISSSLRTELQFDVCRRYIIRHPLWRLWANMDPMLAQLFCRECVGFLFPAPHDDIFLPGTNAECCYYVIDGKLVYTQSTDTSRVSTAKIHHITVGHWLCEAALWSHWIHVGKLEAITETQLLVVHSNEFDQILKRNRMLREITIDYGRIFHSRIVSAKPPQSVWPNDLEVPCTDYGDIVGSMDQSLQQIIGQDALDRASSSPSWNWQRGPNEQSLEQLREELQTGKSVVTVNGNGDIERVASVITLSLEREDGSVFAQIAKMEGSDIVPGCKLPGKKMEHGEPMAEAMCRVLSRLSLDESGVEILETERKTEKIESKEFGVVTKYLKTICHVLLPEEFKPSNMEVCMVRVSQGPPQNGAAAATKEIYILRERSKVFYFAWLTAGEFEDLSTAAGEAVLVSWLAELNRDAACRVSLHSLPPETPSATWRACKFRGPVQTI